MFIVEYKFLIGQCVKLKALGLQGVVMGVATKSDLVHTYYTYWWADGQRFDEWLFDFELEEIKC